MNSLLREVKAQKRFYALAVLVQVVCVMTICFVIGLLLNNEYLSLESESSTLRLDVQIINEDDAMTPSQMEPMLKELLEVLRRKTVGVEYTHQISRDEDDGFHIIYIFDEFYLEDGVYHKGDEYAETIDMQITLGEPFSDEDYIEANTVALVLGCVEGEALGSSVELYGTTYQIIGERHTVHSDDGGNVSVYSIPVTAWGNIPVTGFSISLRSLMTEENREDVYEILQRWYGDAEREVYDYTAENADLKAAYRTTFITCAVILLAAFGVLFMLYGYLFTLKKRKIAINALCGCSRRRCILSYSAENLLICGASALAGLLLFAAVKRLWLEYSYPYMEDIFSWELYVGCFLGMMFLALLQGLWLGVRNIRRNIMEML